MSVNSTFLGPLTTTFTPPGSCFEYIFPFETSALLYANRSMTECFPSGYNAGFLSSGYYSPGVCPSGYATGCASVNTEQAVEGLCCPRYVTPSGRCSSTDDPCRSGYTCRASGTGASTTWPSDEIQYGLCGTDLYGFPPLTFQVSNSKPFAITASRMFAWGIRVRPETPFSAASATSAAPGASVTADLPQPTANTPASELTLTRGLPIGAKVALGVTFPVLICVLATAWVLLRRRRRGARHATATLAELDAENHSPAPRHELAAAVESPHELDAHQTPLSVEAGLDVESQVQSAPIVVRKAVAGGMQESKNL